MEIIGSSKRIKTTVQKETMGISIINVHNNEATTTFFINKLEETLKKTSLYSQTNCKIRLLVIIQKVTKLEDKIIPMTNVKYTKTDIILIVGPTSIKNDINKTIIKVRDTEATIGTVFAKIPTFLCATNINFLRGACRNNTLIFSITGNELEILNYAQDTVDSMILSAFLLRLTMKHKARYIRDRPQMVHTNLQTTRVRANQETYRSAVCVEYALSKMIQTIIEQINSPQSEFLHIYYTLSRFLSDYVISSTDVPSFSVATKQGYAIRVQKEVNEIEAKADKPSRISPIKLDHDTSAKVDKGDPIPIGATAVIPAKNVVHSYDEAGLLIKSTSHTVKYGQNIKFLGSDIEKGKLIINKFTRIRSKEITLLATCNCTEIRVLKKTTIGLLSIGNKLQEPGQPLEPEQLYDCSRIFLISLLKENKFDCCIMDYGIVNINVTLINQNIAAALKTVDLLVITSYFSSKEWEMLRSILTECFGAELYFENVDMKPGKTTAFGLCHFRNKSTCILCLSGNPTSLLVTAYIFFLPLINWIHRNFKEDRLTISAELKQKLLLHSRPRYVWATLSLNKDGRFAKVTCKKGNSINNNLSEIIDANALLRLPSKTPKNSTLETPAFVSATLIKFSNLIS